MLFSCLLGHVLEVTRENEGLGHAATAVLSAFLCEWTFNNFLIEADCLLDWLSIRSLLRQVSFLNRFFGQSWALKVTCRHANLTSIKRALDSKSVIGNLREVLIQCLLIKLALFAFHFGKLSLELFECVDLTLNQWKLICDAFVFNLAVEVSLRQSFIHNKLEHSFDILGEVVV